MRSVVVGSSITFTATVSGAAPPTGTVTFTGLTYNGITPVNTTLASNVPLNASGQASFTTSSLVAGGAFHGSHFITATYNGDASHSAAAVTMVQKIHASGSTLALVSSPNPSNFGQTVVITATVSSLPAGGGTPTGMITFQDGATVIGQAPLDPSGVAFITRPTLTPGSHKSWDLRSDTCRCQSGVLPSRSGPPHPLTLRRVHRARTGDVYAREPRWSTGRDRFGFFKEARRLATVR